MKEKLISIGIGICLGSMIMANPVLAKSENSNSANNQSIKKCPFKAKDADVRLTKKLRNGQVNDNLTPDDPTDDFYEICDSSGANCEPQTNPADLPLAVDLGGGVYQYNGLSIFGSNKSDTIYGTEGDDLICGNNGSDQISGEGGDDSLHGNNGHDTLIGGVGDDDLHGGNGRDDLFGYDDVPTDDPEAGDDLNDDNGVDALDTDKDLLDGGNGKDDLSGGPDDDSLSGGNGTDDMNGNSGNDDILGGRGKDNCVDDGDGGLDDDCVASEVEDD